MPLSLLQGWSTANSGSGTGSLSVTWGGARTIGSLLLLAANSDTVYSTPTGWTLDQSQITNSGLYLWWRIATNTADDAPTLSNSGHSVIAWAEYSGNTATPEDVSTSNGTADVAATAWSTGTTAATAQDDELAVALWGAWENTAGTWSAHTNGFTELIDVATSAAVSNVNLSVATKALSAIGTVESTATPSTTVSRVALVGTYKALVGAIMPTGGWNPILTELNPRKALRSF